MILIRYVMLGAEGTIRPLMVGQLFKRSGKRVTFWHRCRRQGHFAWIGLIFAKGNQNELEPVKLKEVCPIALTCLGIIMEATYDADGRHGGGGIAENGY
jgi:hypothetical protein